MSTTFETRLATDEAFKAAFESLTDEFDQAAVRKLYSFAEAYNQTVEQINALGGDPQALLENLRETYEGDPNVTTIRDQIEQAKDIIFDLEQKLDAILIPVRDQMREQSADELATLEAKEKELKEKVNASKSYFKKTAEIDNVEALFPKVASVKGRGGPKGSTGVRRIRGRKWTVTVNGESTTYDAASEAATALKTDTQKLNEAFFAAAGTDKAADWPDSANFAFGEGVTVTVTKA